MRTSTRQAGEAVRVARALTVCSFLGAPTAGHRGTYVSCGTRRGRRGGRATPPYVLSVCPRKPHPILPYFALHVRSIEVPLSLVRYGTPIQFLVLLVAGWLARHQGEALEYLRAENRVLRARLPPRACSSRTQSDGFSPRRESLSAERSSPKSPRLQPRKRFCAGTESSSPPSTTAPLAADLGARGSAETRPTRS